MTTTILLLLLDASRAPRGTGLTYGAQSNRLSITAWDSSGKVRWEIASPVAYPLGLWPRRGGGCYVGCQEAIVEVGLDGRVVRTIPFRILDLKYATTVQPLSQDRFLIVDFNRGTMAIVDAKGAVEWRPKKGKYYDARRAPSGSVFAVGPGGTLDELDRAGDVVRSFEVGGEGISLDLLSNGGFLVVAGGDVVELDSQGHKRKTFTGLAGAYSAQRLRNGRTLVLERGKERWVELDSEGRIVRETPCGYMRTAVRDD